MADRSILQVLGEHSTSIASIAVVCAGVLTVFGADFPPFASMTRAQEIATKVDAVDDKQSKSVADLKTEFTNAVTTLAASQKTIAETLIEMQISDWELRLKDAQQDLAANPNSTSARNAVAVAELRLKRLRAKQRKSEDDESP